MRTIRVAAGVLTLLTSGVSAAYAQGSAAPVSVTASEPLMLLVVGAGLIGAGWIRRRLIRSGTFQDSLETDSAPAHRRPRRRAGLSGQPPQRPEVEI